MKHLGTETENESIKIPKNNSGENRKITVGTTAPTSPSVGDIWIDTN